MNELFKHVLGRLGFIVEVINMDCSEATRPPCGCPAACTALQLNGIAYTRKLGEWRQLRERALALAASAFLGKL